MNKTMKYGLIVALIIGALVYYLSTQQQADIVRPSVPMDPNRWDVLRENIGGNSMRNDADDTNVWVTIMRLMDPQTKADKDRIWATIHAFFKGVDLKPDGWQLHINLPLQREAVEFVTNNLGISEKSLRVGSLL